MKLFALKSDTDLCGREAFFQVTEQSGISCLCCSVSLLPPQQGILLAQGLREAIAAPSQQSLLASALKRLWRTQDGG